MSEHSGPPTRLIDVNSLELVTVALQVPKYAILSHTWELEEVTLKDWRASGWEQMKGYSKILGACKQAKIDHLRYIWIDTCCIDKTSSAELAQAINSMYNWYRESVVCYACLADVDPPHPDVSLLRPARGKQFKQSRWFTRGWTLQEMLAPEQLLFFDNEWICMGSLRDLLTPVAKITGIDQSALNHSRSLEAFSAAQKFCWASKRSTQRLEDQAYCLLGLLGISLHPNYGEGRRAFIRLQEAIFQQGDDSVFVWDTSALNQQSRLFASAPSDFADSGDVEYDESRPVDSDMWLTNRGVTGRFCLLPRGTSSDTKKSAIAVLNCRQVGYPQKLLALLIRNDSDQESGTTYSIRPRSSQWPRTSIGEKVIRRSARVTSISINKLHLVRRCQITLAREPPVVAFPSVGFITIPDGIEALNIDGGLLQASGSRIFGPKFAEHIDAKVANKGRQLTYDEAQALYRFENHVCRCQVCTAGCAQAVFALRPALCKEGEKQFREVRHYLCFTQGGFCSTLSGDDGSPAFLDIPLEYKSVRSLLSPRKSWPVA